MSRVCALSFLFIFLLISGASRADMTSDGIALYKSREFSMAAFVLAEAVTISPEDDDAHYYLALSLSQMGKGEETAEALKPLLERDPCFYRYKIDFDSDFDPIRHSSDMVSLRRDEPFDKLRTSSVEPSNHAADPTPLAIDQTSKDQICQTSAGLFFYHRGLKIQLAPPSDQPYTGGFVDDDSLYFLIDESDDPKKPKPKTILFSREGRERRPLPEGTAPADLSATAPTPTPSPTPTPDSD